MPSYNISAIGADRATLGSDLSASMVTYSMGRYPSWCRPLVWICWSLQSDKSIIFMSSNLPTYWELSLKHKKSLTLGQKGIKLRFCCGCGGIGRRAGFRCLWALARGGSTPLIRIGFLGWKQGFFVFSNVFSYEEWVHSKKGAWEILKYNDLDGK